MSRLHQITKNFVSFLNETNVIKKGISKSVSEIVPFTSLSEEDKLLAIQLSGEVAQNVAEKIIPNFIELAFENFESEEKIMEYIFDLVNNLKTQIATTLFAKIINEKRSKWSSSDIALIQSAFITPQTAIVTELLKEAFSKV